MGMQISMRRNKVSESEIRLMEMELDYMSEVEEDTEELFVIKILSSKYDEMKPKEVASSQQHLTVQQQQDLQRMLEKYPQLFN